MLALEFQCLLVLLVGVLASRMMPNCYENKQENNGVSTHGGRAV